MGDLRGTGKEGRGERGGNGTDWDGPEWGGVWRYWEDWDGLGETMELPGDILGSAGTDWDGLGYTGLDWDILGWVDCG